MSTVYTLSPLFEKVSTKHTCLYECLIKPNCLVIINQMIFISGHTPNSFTQLEGSEHSFSTSKKKKYINGYIHKWSLVSGDINHVLLYILDIIHPLELVVSLNNYCVYPKTKGWFWEGPAPVHRCKSSWAVSCALVPLPLIPICHSLFTTHVVISVCSWHSCADETSLHAAHITPWKHYWIQPSVGKLSLFIHFHILMHVGKHIQCKLFLKA